MPRPNTRRAKARTRTERPAAGDADTASGGAFVAAIVGRPNVGKSTLFNRLVGRRAALVHDRPGVTRDRRYGAAQLGPLQFTVIDTAGFEDAAADTLEGRMRRQTEKAITESDVVLLLVDGRAGVTPLDEHFAELVRRSAAPVILVVNKTEGKGGEAAALEAYRLGLGEPVAISAEHGEGLDALYHALEPHAGFEQRDPDEDVEPAVPAEHQGDAQTDILARPLELAIIGRPNTGKSTLINRLLGEERLLTGPEPGVTRDAIAIDWTYGGRRLRLIDTAGVRKRAKVIDAIEKLSVGETFGAVRMAAVVVLVVDAAAPLEAQELQLARHVAEEGRALVIAVNKWDAIKEKRRVQEIVTDRLAESLSQVRGLPVVMVSGKTGLRVDELMQAVFKVHETWNARVPTAALNRWLTAATRAHPTPLSTHKQRIKLRYATQPKSRPPTFVIFTTRPGDLPEAYMRYLANSLRDAFDLDGVPIRIHLRKTENPFEGRS